MKGATVRRRVDLLVRSEDGQALVEFALVIPMLLLLMLGLVEFSRAWNAQQVLTDVARESLRGAVVANSSYSYDEMRRRIDDALVRASMDPDRATVDVSGWKAGTGTPARIDIEYEFSFAFIAPLIGWASEDRSLVLTTSFVMRNE
ncbi:MAG: pilus assembly protein [Gemmatimonadetes bacterium]|nr:pilus assembly protein [Gemmatimonadota bacterium]NNF11751.1 pilus assembly protein [Gemmatimonadota bacterium]